MLVQADLTVVVPGPPEPALAAELELVAEQESAGAWWTESGPQLPVDAVVAMAVDEDGRVVAATLSPSTRRLLITRRKDEPGLALEAWREV